ncbi:MAG: SDR family NAD(P)-dependent oxidoreductase, partial [Acidimicrobiales bacterium]|nr:SDR family NAD(P)-dependent oxidoreductase [Acidimicrobiales bacterium]
MDGTADGFAAASAGAGLVAATEIAAPIDPVSTGEAAAAPAATAGFQASPTSPTAPIDPVVPAPPASPTESASSTSATESIAEDLDIGAFGAGDPTAFGAGAGGPGGLPGEEASGTTEGLDTAAAASATSSAVGAAHGGDAGGAVADRSAAAPAVRAAAVTLLGELGAGAMLRRDLSAAAGRPLVVRRDTGEDARRFVARDDLATVAQVGPATPDHVLRTKRVPLVGRDVAGYVRAYEAYVERNRPRLGDRPLVPVDPAPRVVVDPELGVLTAGARPADAATAAEIYRHTMWVIERAVELGGYAAVAEADLFDVEYWELEQAKLARQPAPSALTGRIALVTGAASGIGLATVRALLADGAAVVGLDLDPAVDEVADGPGYVGVQGNAAGVADVSSAVEASVRAFGGLDALVLNAG